jgi:hypothetical protein
MKRIFDLPERGISDVLEVKGGFIVVQVRSLQPPRVLSFDEAKDRVQKDFIREKAQERALQDAEKLLAQAKSLSSLSKAAADSGMKAEKSPFLNRLRPDIGFGVWGDELERLMDLTETVSLPEKPVKAMASYMVCQWTESKPPDEKVVEEEARKFKPMLMEQIMRSYWDGWRKSLRNQAKIEVLQQI